MLTHMLCLPAEGKNLRTLCGSTAGELHNSVLASHPEDVDCRICMRRAMSQYKYLKYWVRRLPHLEGSR